MLFLENDGYFKKIQLRRKEEDGAFLNCR